MTTRIKRFAEGTTVTPEASRAEAEKLLAKYGAKEIGLMTSEVAGVSVIIFVAEGRKVKLEVKHPTEAQWEDEANRRNLWPYHQRYKSVRQGWFVAELARRWRVLVLRLKAKLEMCADDPAAFDREFLPEIMLPDNRTVGETVIPMIDRSYAERGNVLMLPGME